MNTTEDLRAEFDRLASRAPDVAALRGAVHTRDAARSRRRRRTAVIAVAASVVVVAGGITVAGSMMRSDPTAARPAAPAAVVAVPEVPLPENTALISHQLSPVESPVAATPPAGLTGISWTNGPGRLSVVYFDPLRPTDLAGGARYGAPIAADRPGAGYVITPGPDDALIVIGEGGPRDATVEAREITVAGHAATLTIAEDGAVDQLGFPAAERISWQLADGSYIHVWAAGVATRDSSPSTALVAFAESIREQSTVLRRTVGIGLTLPGFTVDTSTNTEPLGGYIAGSLWLCVDGIDPLDPATQALVSNEAGAREATMARGCLVASVVNGAQLSDVQLDGADKRTVNGREIRVSTQYSTAFADLGHGLTGVVTAPTGFGQVEDEPVDHDRVVADLAALAASITLAPDVEILPFDPGPAGSSQESSGGSGESEPTASGEATSGPPPRTIEFPEGGETDAAVNPEAGTVRLQFPLRNASDETVDVNTITVTGQGLTQIGTTVRLDNLPSDVDTAFQPVDRPAMFAPGAQVQLRVTLRADQCPLPSSGPDAGWLEITVDYSDGGGDGQIGTRAVTDGWADALDARCE